MLYITKKVQGLFTKEKALSQENQNSLTVGLSCSKVESIRQQYLKVSATENSDEVGLKLCKKLVWILNTKFHLYFKRLDVAEAKELWILLTLGKDVLKGHRREMSRPPY